MKPPRYPVRNRRRRLKAAAPLILTLLGIVTLLRLFSIYPNHHEEIEPPQPVVGKVSMIYGNHSIYERGLETHREHARRHGYPLFVLRRPILDGVWNKYAILLSALLEELQKPPHKRLEWLFWADGDTVLMNPNIPLEIFLPPPHIKDVHMVLTKDWNGMNNGVFPIRVHPWSVELLSAAIAYPYIHPEVELYWPDQSALQFVLDGSTYFSQSVVYCPLRWFNAYMAKPDGSGLNPDSPKYLQVHQGDLLVHFPGTPADHLNTTIGPYLDIAELHRPDWELPLESTGYIEETQKFWQEFRP
ncbi:hypothetical protein N8T08_000361 [Aspergillus melleus]|uniref:Uncharacterized protein n=1 Tax=Aspergillus melleus TaxID=138277 RepID=A0ACC3BB03_9EURO|nr:hypothetical protein N8T08_000361 [Aspergillus melleus]